MKNKIATLLLALAGIIAPLASRADVIWYEGFNYNPPVGGSYNLTNVSLGVWTNFSGSGNHDMLLPANSRLEVSTTGNAVTSRADDDCRFMAVTNNSQFTNHVQVVYASFTVTCTNLPSALGSYFASFYNPKSGTGGGYFGRVMAFTGNTTVPNTWRLGVAANGIATNAPGGGFPVDLALNTPYQIVEELDPVTLDAASIWINPINVNNTGQASTDPLYTSGDSIGAATSVPVTAYAFRQASSFGNGFWVITNLCLATTFAEAMTNIFPTNAYSPKIVYQPVGVTNFPNSSFNLAVVANGQGLASLTYQWRKNGVNFSNPNGNSYILPFSNVSASAGTNDYDVIVTTPYGLSATSSVATVAIDTTPQPPIFVTQPISTNLYQGLNAIFTTTVATPGNAAFTWYSNNVVITAGVSSSQYASSLELDNITTANAATFKVAVTNDVFPTGIVSSNATLTVKVPAAVSIAYLHQLVDKTTWQATNVPPSIAYVATGIVTTYTNITTGDTASYYLQDGTGGINIFVTGGSSGTAGFFRPQLGDVVTFVGVVSSLTSGLELYADATAGSAFPYTSFTVLSNNIAGLPAPRSIGFNILTNVPYANTNLGGLYVQISDVHFGVNAGIVLSTTANNFVGVTNSSGQAFNLFFPYLDLDVAGQTLPSYAYTINGQVYSLGGLVTNEIVVTRWSDVVTSLPAPIPLTANFSGGTATFTWSDASFLLQDSTNVLGPYNTITGAVSPFVTNTTSHPTLFFRLVHP